MAEWNYTTPEELEADGYEKQPGNARCRGPRCGAEIEWWKTPTGKMMPLDPDTLLPHWKICPDADSFRGQGRLF
jgi:hypothetical protein